MNYRTRFAVLLGLVVAASPVSAQSRSSDTLQSFATRASLEARAEGAERVVEAETTSATTRKQKQAEIQLLRERLRVGDFQVGDRVFVSVLGEKALTDTFVVRSGSVLQLPSYPPLSLAGALRSELLPLVTAHVGRYLRSPVVNVTPLLRVSVTGSVGRPGFYNVTPDALISDVIMMAGGPASNADINKVEVRRGADVLIPVEQVRTAVQHGTSLDELDLRGGDAIVVAQKKSTNWTAILSSVGTVLAAVSIVVGLSR